MRQHPDKVPSPPLASTPSNKCWHTNENNTEPPQRSRGLAVRDFEVGAASTSPGYAISTMLLSWSSCQHCITTKALKCSQLTLIKFSTYSLSSIKEPLETEAQFHIVYSIRNMYSISSAYNINYIYIETWAVYPTDWLIDIAGYAPIKTGNSLRLFI